VLHQTDERMQECIDRCQSCKEICLASAVHCLEVGGRHAAPDHVRLLISCAEICGTSARLMRVGSDQHERTCEVCADICETCADACQTFDDDELMQQCAESCRRCAESCRKMVGMQSRAW
jgi:hypothetical protein